MKEEKREVRSMSGGRFQPKLREETEITGGGRTIEGYAIVFGVESRLIVDYWDDYREIIEPGAITEEDLAGMDIKMTLWHNRERLLARSNKGVGSLRLTVDEVGVKYEFDAPNTPDGETAIELVKRGDLAGSSFTYWTDEAHNVRYEKGEDEILIRHVDRISLVMEITIASDPAYTQTSVTARELEAAGVRNGKREEEMKREEEKRRAEAIEKVRKMAKTRFFK